MPLLLHNWREVVDLWIEAVDVGDDESLGALLEYVYFIHWDIILRSRIYLVWVFYSLLQKLTYDLRTTLLPSYADTLTRLLNLLPRSIPAQALTALLSTLSALFKYLLIPSINNSIQSEDPTEDQGLGDEDLLLSTWMHTVRILRKCNPEVQRAVGELWGASVLRRLKGNEREHAIRLLIDLEDMEGLQEVKAWIVVFTCKVCISSLSRLGLKY
jgi:U3 small nucleolar RNA-associated protein 20